MYKVQKTMEVSASHSLRLDYDSPCQRRHGHNYFVTVYVEAEELNDVGMVVDFTHIKKNVHDFMDHRDLNELFSFNPTAENMAKWITDSLNAQRTVEDLGRKLKCYRVDIEETKNNIATWEED